MSQWPRSLRYVGVALVAIMLSVPFTPVAALADSYHQGEPITDLSEEEVDQFVEYYMDVFSRGTRELDETPESYDYTQYLKGQLALEVYKAVRDYSAESRREFSVEVAAPALGLSTPEDPFTGKDGEPVTQADVDNLYKGFFAALIFDRVAFFETLEDMMSGVNPAGVPESPTAGVKDDSHTNNEIRERLRTEPMKYWANDLEDPVLPEWFVDDPLSVTTDPPVAPPTDIAQSVATSPFTLATDEEWQSPDFYLKLPDLLDFLSGLGDVAEDDVLTQLGLLAADAEAVVEHVSGTIDAFPELKTNADALMADIEVVRSHVLDLGLPTPLALRLSPEAQGGQLPPEIQDAMDEASLVAGETQYVVVVNDYETTGTWGVPGAVDIDGDGVTDLVITLSLRTVDTDAASGLVREVPYLTVQRPVDAETASATGGTSAQVPGAAAPYVNYANSVGDSAEPTAGSEVPDVPQQVNGPYMGGIDLTVAFVPPQTSAVAALNVQLENGADLFDTTLYELNPEIDMNTVGASGAFSYGAIIQDGGVTSFLHVAGPDAPDALAAAAELDPTTGAANLRLKPGASGQLDAAGDVTVVGVAFTNQDRVAIAVGGDKLTELTITSTGTEIDVDGESGMDIEIVRQDYVGASTTRFLQTAFNIAGGPASATATLSQGSMTVKTPTKGGSFETFVGDAVGNAYLSSSWAAVTDAGRNAGFAMADGVIEFTSDKAVGQVRATVADTPAATGLGAVPMNALIARDGFVGFSQADVMSANIAPNGALGYGMDMMTTGANPIIMDVVRGGDSAYAALSNVPARTMLGLAPDGIDIGSSGAIGTVFGVIDARMDGLSAPATRTYALFEGVDGTVSTTTSDATMNMMSMGNMAGATVLGSNVLGLGGYQFDSLVGNHVLADVDGLARQYSMGLGAVAGSLTGGLFGPLGAISLRLEIEGPLCQSFGAGDNLIELCISNVPSEIDISFGVLPNPNITYDANEIIDSITLRLINPSLDVQFAILAIPKHISLDLTAGAVTLTTDTRLGGLTFLGHIGSTTLAAGILDLPTQMGVSWGSGGVTPTMPANDAIGRVYLGISRPGLSFLVDIVHLPNTSISWGASSIDISPAGGQRIGSALVQLAVSDLLLSANFVGIPGVTATWGNGGGTVTTTARMDLIDILLVKGSTLSLDTEIEGIPKLTASWDQDSMAWTLIGGKIDRVYVNFQVNDLLLLVQALGVPTTTISTNANGFSFQAPTALDSLSMVFAKGGVYYNPFFQPTDFVGAYLRPEEGQIGISAKVTGIKEVELRRNLWTGDRILDLGFTGDKDFRIIGNLATSAIKLYTDITFTGLAAQTTFTFGDGGMTISGTPASWQWSPRIKGDLRVGTPAAYDATPTPRWPYQTSGGSNGIMGNTQIDTHTSGVATKWRIDTPLPTSLSLSKTTSQGIPQFNLNTGVSLGKLDVRTNLRVNLNTCTSSWCSPQYLDTMVVAFISNLPTTLSVSQGLGAGVNSGNPSLGITTGQSINNLFLGLRFDQSWYSSANQYGGFPIWASLGQIPTSVSLNFGKTGGWNGGKTPFFSYSANSNSLDAAFFLDIGALWNQFGKTGILNAASAGRPVPTWLKGLAQYNAEGHLKLELTDIPASGIAIYKSGSTYVVDPQGWTPLTRAFLDFNLLLSRTVGDSGNLICCSPIKLAWYWTFSYQFGIYKLSLLLENLRYVSVDFKLPESTFVIDGRMVFHFLAGAGFQFSAGVYLDLSISEWSGRVFCACITLPWITFLIDPGFISYQIITKSFGIQYLFLPYWCHVSWSSAGHWCTDHYYIGVTYHYPGNWGFDAFMNWPPHVPFRGLDIGYGTYKVVPNPRLLTCVNNFCWEIGRLVPIEVVVVYAFIKHFWVSGISTWSVHHHHFG